MSEYILIGENVRAKVEGKKLILEVDTTERLRASRSGKSTLVATTSGNVSVPTSDGNVTVGLNVYQKI